MIRALAFTAALTLCGPAFAQEAVEDPSAAAPLDRPSAEHPGEFEVDPYVRSNANAGAAPFEGTAMFEAFNGREGIARIVEEFADRSLADPRLTAAFAAVDEVRFRRTLNEQFCYILGGGCDYTGRDMASSHRDIGGQATDFAAIVENLQAAMAKEGVPFAAQNRFLAKLAPMRRDTVVR